MFLSVFSFRPSLKSLFLLFFVSQTGEFRAVLGGDYEVPESTNNALHSLNHHQKGAFWLVF